MLVVTRHAVAESDGEAFLASARTALESLSRCRGYVRGHAARSTDDPRLWLLSTEWRSVGDYRRALSSYDVKVHAVPVMYTAQDEPSAFEVLLALDEAEPGRDAAAPPPGVRRSYRAADAATVAVGEASAPYVGTTPQTATGGDEGRGQPRADG